MLGRPGVRRILRQAAPLIGGGRVLSRTAIRLGPSDGIRILNFHGTPARSRDGLRAHLVWLGESFTILTPTNVFAILDGMMAPPPGRSAMLTFDDGLRSNYQVAAPILEDLGLRGLFFVSPGFCATGNPEEFLTTRIRPGFRCTSAEDYEPLTRGHVKDLHLRGHVIGNHTFNHSNLSTLSAEDGKAEIDTAKSTIEEWTDAPCRAFAWTFGWNVISAPAFEHALTRHDVCFSPCPGWNRWPTIDRTLLLRSNVESHHSQALFRTKLSPLRDVAWHHRQREMRSILGR
jgi:Polysaccharide deacetylase